MVTILPFSSCQDSLHIIDSNDNESVKKTICDITNDRNSDVKYFWYNGECYTLTPDYTKLFIVSEVNSYNSLNNIIDEGIYSSQIPERMEEARRVGTEYKWQIVNNTTNKLNTASAHSDCNIVYSSPFYTSGISGKQVGVSNLIHVKLKSEEDIDILNHQLDLYNMTIFSQNEYIPLWYTISCNDNLNGNALDICLKLHNSGLFSIVEPDFLCDNILTSESFKKPNDPYYSKQWYLSGSNSINWPDASLISNGKNVTVGLIDTGVDMIHPDFSASSVNPVYDSVTREFYVNGLYGPHGMSCAGIIASTVNNNIGIAGISPGVTLHSYSDKLQPRPNITQDLANALTKALLSVDVLSCSWGGADLISSEISDAIRMFMPSGRKGKGVVVVFSSGNDNSSVLFPANCNEDIIVVGSTNKSGKRSTFSNYGNELDVMAPGESIYTLGFNGNNTHGYNSDFNGTSASCPQVAAIASLILSVNSNLTNTQVADIIEQTARKTDSYIYTTNSNRPNGSWNMYMGYGLVDAAAAVRKAQSVLNK